MVRMAVFAHETSSVPTKNVLFSGGVFQNTLLLRFVERNLRKVGFQTLRHRLIPANDGGVSLGQAVCAAARLLGETIESETEERRGR